MSLISPFVQKHLEMLLENVAGFPEPFGSIVLECITEPFVNQGLNWTGVRRAKFLHSKKHGKVGGRVQKL